VTVKRSKPTLRGFVSMMSLKDGRENPALGSVAWFLEEIYPMKFTWADKIGETVSNDVAE
jgi:hypothetical protein